MPYIKQGDKELLGGADDFGEPIRFDVDAPGNAGELNYVLTRFCKEYFYANGGRYQQINDIIGALEGCKLEFYRRLVGPYEDKKIKENGDVY